MPLIHCCIAFTMSSMFGTSYLHTSARTLYLQILLFLTAHKNTRLGSHFRTGTHHPAGSSYCPSHKLLCCIRSWTLPCYFSDWHREVLVHNPCSYVSQINISKMASAATESRFSFAWQYKKLSLNLKRCSCNLEIIDAVNSVGSWEKLSVFDTPLVILPLLGSTADLVINTWKCLF